MQQRDYTSLLADLSDEFRARSPKSATWAERANRVMVDGGNHALRLIRPFPPRIRAASGAWVEDEDGHRILDFWQGHYGNVLGHNPPMLTSALEEMFARGYGLQDGFTHRWDVEAAELICLQTGHERVRFTTSGTLATMYAMMLAQAFTSREVILKVGGGWHGGHPWALKGVGWHGDFESIDSAGIPQAVGTNVLVTDFNRPDMLEKHFRDHGDRIACLILEPVIGAGGLMPATREYIHLARELTEKHGALLIMDEVITGFRFRAGDVAPLYGVKGDLTTLGKAVGGGMPVAAVAGRADVLDLAGRAGGSRVKFSGGTYAAHPSSMLAACTLMAYLVEHEEEIYSTLAAIGAETRAVVRRVFEEEGIPVRFAGDKNDALPHSSLHMLLFPYDTGLALDTPSEVLNPALCDIQLSEVVLQLAMLLEDVYIVHGLGSTTTAHTGEDIRILGEAYRRAARRIKPYL